MNVKTKKVVLTARVLGLAAAAIFAASTLSGCDVLHSQLEQFAPGDHSGHDH